MGGLAGRHRRSFGLGVLAAGAPARNPPVDEPAAQNPSLGGRLVPRRGGRAGAPEFRRPNVFVAERDLVRLRPDRVPPGGKPWP